MHLRDADRDIHYTKPFSVRYQVCVWRCVRVFYAWVCLVSVFVRVSVLPSLPVCVCALCVCACACGYVYVCVHTHARTVTPPPPPFFFSPQAKSGTHTMVLLGDNQYAGPQFISALNSIAAKVGSPDIVLHMGVCVCVCVACVCE